MAHLEWEDDAGHVVAVRFDAVRVVDHRQNAEATTHPVQKGADIADHVRVELPTVSLNGYVSIAPLTSLAAIPQRKEAWTPSGRWETIELPPPPGTSLASAFQGGLVQAAVNALTGVTSPNSVESLITDAPDARVRAMTDLLTEAQEKRRMVRFVDQARDYEDMVIVGITVTRTQREHGATFQIELQQIRTVETMLVDAPVPREVRGLAAKAAGAAAAKAGANESADEKKKSAALQGAQKLLGGIGLGDLL